MTGGFIGVDVFFVISGYLISGIIIKQTLKKSFSYLDFYSRRVKRIYPALILVLLTVLIISIWKLLQTPLKIVTKTMAASTVFGANIEILTYEKDYFDPDVKTNPLLHLWSLGVE
jgi:peptidoglycan/LPS O-acetylase OafA/YrhL